MLNLAIRFVLELAGLAAIAFSAFTAVGGGTVGVIAGIAAAVLFGIAWGRIAAPRAQNGLTLRNRQLAGAGLLLAVAAWLAWAGLPFAALIFAAAVIANQALLIVLHADADLDAARNVGAGA